MITYKVVSETTLEDTLLFSCQRPDRLTTTLVVAAKKLHAASRDSTKDLARLQRSLDPVVERTGVEPATLGLQSRCSPN